MLSKLAGAMVFVIAQGALAADRIKIGQVAALSGASAQPGEASTTDNGGT